MDIKSYTPVDVKMVESAESLEKTKAELLESDKCEASEQELKDRLKKLVAELNEEIK